MEIELNGCMPYVATSDLKAILDQIKEKPLLLNVKGVKYPVLIFFAEEDYLDFALNAESGEAPKGLAKDLELDLEIGMHYTIILNSAYQKHGSTLQHEFTHIVQKNSGMVFDPKTIPWIDRVQEREAILSQILWETEFCGSWSKTPTWKSRSGISPQTDAWLMSRLE